MNSKSNAVLVTSVAVIFTIMVLVPQATFAGTNQITVTPVSNEINIEKTLVTMNIPHDNTLPWGAVSGTVTNYADAYPVIIQIYQDDSPIHFAQVDIEEDGSYEYVFRIRNVDSITGDVVNIFEGVYTVAIYTAISPISGLV